jgi:hypothetical protein
LVSFGVRYGHKYFVPDGKGAGLVENFKITIVIDIDSGRRSFHYFQKKQRYFGYLSGLLNILPWKKTSAEVWIKWYPVSSDH